MYASEWLTDTSIMGATEHEEFLAGEACDNAQYELADALASKAQKAGMRKVLYNKVQLRKVVAGILAGWKSDLEAIELAGGIECFLTDDEWADYLRGDEEDRLELFARAVKRERDHGRDCL